MISQPGLMADYAESGLLVPLTRFFGYTGVENGLF